MARLNVYVPDDLAERARLANAVLHAPAHLDAEVLSVLGRRQSTRTRLSRRRGDHRVRHR